MDNMKAWGRRRRGWAQQTNGESRWLREEKDGGGEAGRTGSMDESWWGWREKRGDAELLMRK